MKIAEIVKFIRENDIDHEKWTDSELAIGIHNAITGKAFGCVKNEDGSIRGMYLGKWVEPYTNFQVIAIIGRGAFKDLLKMFRKEFPECKKFVGYRHVHSQSNGKYVNGLVKFKEYSNSNI